MARNLSRRIALVLAMIMCMGFAGISTQAETEDGYFRSIYPKPYEMSGHMMSANGGANNDIPQTLVIAPAVNYQPATLVSGWQALYCCDAENGYNGNVLYHRVNLEDSSYYSDSAARHIRTIVTNSYPFVSMSSMKSRLAANGFEGAEKLTRSEVISAVQAAIWHYANGEVFSYTQTFDVRSNSQWGSPFHHIDSDYEEIWWNTGKRKFTVNEDVGDRINRLRDYMMNLSGKNPSENQVVITELKIIDSIPVLENGGVYKVALRVQLNSSGSGSGDNIALKITVDGKTVQEKTVRYGQGTSFDMVIEAKNGQKIEAEVNGTQILPKGVYFYEPVDGRSISQCLVGIAEGATSIHASKAVTLNVGENPVFGKLILKKTDLNGKALSGAKFELFAVGSKDSSVGTYTVGNDGQLVIDNLLPGKYYVVETKAPFGYVRAEGKFEFTIDKNGAVSASKLNEEGVLVVENGPFEFRFPSGGASNISYMLIGKDGSVDFVRKIDLRDGDTTAPIIVKPGYVSAMFIKQSTSGMFLLSQKVDDEVVEAVIECLKENNPSYKDHDADIKFGFGKSCRL